MHEHGSEERRKITGGIRKEAARNESPPRNKRITASLLDKEKHDVQRNQGIRNQRNSSARGIVVADWEHRIDLLLSACKARKTAAISARLAPRSITQDSLTSFPNKSLH
jgi:hypothetical protein